MSIGVEKKCPNCGVNLTKYPDFFGRSFVAAMMGSMTSPKKAAACRLNGMKGGRKKKSAKAAELAALQEKIEQLKREGI